MSDVPARARRFARSAVLALKPVVESRWARLALMAASLLAAALLVRHSLRDVAAGEVISSLRRQPAWTIAASVLLTVISYGCLGGQEWFALRLMGRRRPLERTLLASAMGNALSNLMGFGLASGSAVRLRLYRWARLRPRDIAVLVLLFSLATYLTGIVTMGLAGLVAFQPIAAASRWPAAAVAVVCLLLLAPAAIWFLPLPKAFRHRRRARRPQISGPDRAWALAAGVGDWIFSGAALYVLSGQGWSGLPEFLAIFCLGSLVGAAVGVPGGIGVLEAAVLGLRAHDLAHQTAAALIAYRAIYFIIPFLLAAAGMAVAQVRRAARTLKASAGEAGK